MKLALISPALPPQLDGIGDYSAKLAAELSTSNEVVVFTSEDQVADPIAGVRVVQAFDWSRPRSNWQLVERVREERPDWVIVQYNPFGWGRRGLNLQLPRVLRRISGFSKVAVMFHERYFASAGDWRRAPMAAWQRWQYRQLVAAASVCLYSTEPWVPDHQKRFPGKPADLLPVGSNLPLSPGSRDDARRMLGIQPTTVVLGLFGSAHVSRLLPWIRLAAENLRAKGTDSMVLYLGPDQKAITEALPDVPVRCEGALPAAEVSRRLRAIDIYLSPFIDGVSTRRGSLLAALQHGLATVGTTGHSTGPLLASQADRAFLLVPSDAPQAFVAAVERLAAEPELRARLERNGEALFRSTFSWGQITSRLVEILQQSTGSASA